VSDIGGVSCDLLSGPAPALRERVEVWQVPGIDGYGAQTLGKGDAQYSFAAVRFGTSAEVDAWYASVQALQGSVLTVVDDWGTSHTSILLTRVNQLRKSAAQLPGTTRVARGAVEIEGVKAN